MTIVLSSLRARQDAAERDSAIEALKISDGSIVRAARMIGIHRDVFRKIVDRHQLHKLIKCHSHEGRPIAGNAAWRALADA